jgi:hypothetical protein
MRTRLSPRATKGWSRGVFVCISLVARRANQGKQIPKITRNLLLGLTAAGLIMESVVSAPAFAADNVSLFKVITSVPN